MTARMRLSRLVSVLRCTGRAAAVAPRSKSCSISASSVRVSSGSWAASWSYTRARSLVASRGERRSSSSARWSSGSTSPVRPSRDRHVDDHAQLVERLQQLGAARAAALRDHRARVQAQLAPGDACGARAPPPGGPPTPPAGARARSRAASAMWRCDRPRRRDQHERPVGAASARSRCARRAGGPRRSAPRRRTARASSARARRSSSEIVGRGPADS